MAFAVARTRMQGIDYLAYAIAVVMAATLGLRQPGEAIGAKRR
jgi:hypothetical protein